MKVKYDEDSKTLTIEKGETVLLVQSQGLGVTVEVERSLFKKMVTKNGSYSLFFAGSQQEEESRSEGEVEHDGSESEGVSDED